MDVDWGWTFPAFDRGPDFKANDAGDSPGFVFPGFPPPGDPAFTHSHSRRRCYLTSPVGRDASQALFVGEKPPQAWCGDYIAYLIASAGEVR